MSPRPIIICIRYLPETKENKFFVVEPWPDETTITSDFLAQGTPYMRVEHGQVEFKFENGRAIYVLFDQDPFSRLVQARLSPDSKFRPMTKQEAA